MSILRVFPRRTAATPRDALAFVGEPPLWIPETATEIHVSCAFTWDLHRAEQLARSWGRFGLPVHLGGPALMEPSGEFTPGRYMGAGHVITSRGCPNSCWFCRVPEREGALRELSITEGWLVHDDNLLACGEQHFRAVLSMLARQPHPAEFRGGLEAARLQPWHVEALRGIRVAQIFLAYDGPEDLEPVEHAAQLLLAAGYTRTSHDLRCYVLIGYPGDTFGDAEARLLVVRDFGLWPMAMLWHDESGDTDREWRRFQRLWARPALIGRQGRLAV